MIHYRKRTLPIIALTALVVITLLLIPLGDRDAFSVSDRSGRLNPYVLSKALTDAVKLAKENYYKDIDSAIMYEGAIRGALAALKDPYTFYQPPIDRKREAENLYHAKFGGLGIRIYPEKGFIKIARPLPNTPAMRVGLQAGDYITKVDGDGINIGVSGGQTLEEVVDKLRGQIGTKVTITIQRRGRAEPFDVTLTRAEIKIDSVEKNMLEDGIGYIKVNSFTGRTSEEFRNTLFSLLHNENSELKSLILDLRDNSGGLLSAANDVADAFISEGIIVSTKGRISKFNREYPATSSALCPQEVNLVVLVNGFSASGSEIVAGAIKDSKRGVLLGTKTFGKGVVQQRFSLKNGSGAVSLTISTYYTPSGVSINEKGVMPHKVVEPSELIDPTKLDIVDAVMRQKAGKHVNDFVEDWIETEEKRTGKTPKDFSQLEARLPELMNTLAENEITLRSELARIRAHRIFDRNVGINRIPADRENDNQLQEAIQLIRTGGIEQALASTTTTEL